MNEFAIGINEFKPADRTLQWHRGYGRGLIGNHLPELLLSNELYGVCAVTRGQQPVKGTGTSSPLHMAEHGHPCLEAGAPAYLIRYDLSHAAEPQNVAVGGLLAGAVLVEATTLTLLVWVLKGDLLPPAPWLLLARAATTGLFGGLLYAASRVPWKQRREARRRVRLT